MNSTQQPFYTETQALFDAVKTHDFDALAALCDDDFGIVDLDTEGKNVIIADRVAWEEWFHTLFGQLTQMNAATDTEIERYQALQTAELGYSVVEFCQTLTVSDHTSRFFCVATIIWKPTHQGWKESRWHCSLIRVEP